MTTMKSALVFKTSDGGIDSKLVDTPAPTAADLKPDQVLIKVIVSGSNPKDWKLPVMFPGLDNTNSGDDVAGVVTEVGSAVTDFHVGDRVAAFHEMTKPWGSYAEYAVAYEHTTFHIPEKTSYEEAATIPLAAMTAAVGLFRVLGVPEPWAEAHDERRERIKGGIAVYGAASAVGAFVIKILNKANIHPIICVAGRGKDFVETLIDRSKGDTIVDYRDGDEAVVKGLKDAVPNGETLRYAYDAVSEHGSIQNLCKVLDVQKGAKMTTVLPWPKSEEVPSGLAFARTQVGDVHAKPEGRELGQAWFRIFGLGLKDGWFTGHPSEIVDGGLAGVGKAMQQLKDGKVSAKKLVFRVADTEGISSKL